MAQQWLTESESRPTEVLCRHHWVIESPHGATSEGVCKKCGDTREFSNSTPEPSWDRDSAPMPRSGRWGAPVRTEIYPTTGANDLWEDAV